MSSDDLRRDLEHLADRTTPGARGAADVWQRASAAAVARRHPPVLIAGALAAAVLAVVGMLAVINRDTSDTTLDSAGGVTVTTTAGKGKGNPLVVGGATTIAPTATTTPATAAPAPSTTPPTLPPKVLAATRLRPFRSCGDYLATARAKAIELAGPYGVPGLGGANYGVPVRDGAVGGEAPPAPSSPQPVQAPALPRTDEGPVDYSTTNTQEVGVDEPDTVKTDGRRILALAEGKLWYVALDGTVPRIAGSLSLDGAWGNQLLVAGDRALVVQTQTIYPLAMSARSAEGVAASDVVYPYPIQIKSTLAIVDVSTPAMKVLKTISVDGSYVSARMVDNIARIVVRSSPEGFTWQYPPDASPEAQAAATERNREVVRTSSDDAWLPSLTVADAAGHPTTSRSLVACDAALHPQAFAGFGMLTVLTVDPAKPDAASSTTIQADGEQVYASRGSLYVATTSWERTVPAPSGGAPGVVQAPETLIHKFAIDDPGKATYLVSGRVRGTALNQYSFSEDASRLRVATTDIDESFVTVLDDTGAALVQIGQVGGLGKGEHIYAVRFLGDQAYVVTFRQIDPLYVVDLRDPAKPKIAGEVELLGYSAYLHPIGDGLLLGVGQDASPEGRRAGAQVSVFDVSDPAHPKRLHQVKLGNGSSSAEYDPHVFLWWAKTGLAVIPYISYDGQNGAPGFIGAIGISASRAGLGEKGRIQQPQDNTYGGGIERSMVIGSLVLTFSQNGVLTSEIADLSPRSFARFA